MTKGYEKYALGFLNDQCQWFEDNDSNNPRHFLKALVKTHSIKQV